MDFKRVHHLREVMVKDWRGKDDGTMQYSYDNASYLKPHFMEVDFADQAKARELYYSLGGFRATELQMGQTIIIPNRGWAWRDLFD